MHTESETHLFFEREKIKFLFFFFLSLIVKQTKKHTFVCGLECRDYRVMFRECHAVIHDCRVRDKQASNT